MSPHRITQRRSPHERRSHRRRWDVYKELGKFAGLIGCVSAAILGQAELVGEPYRHWIAVTAIVCTAVWAYGMKPKNLQDALAFLKRK